MDKLDRKILALYRHDTKISSENIGSAVGLSASAVQRRIKQLRSNNVIEKEIAQLNSGKFGIRMLFMINVDLIHERSSNIGAFEKKMQSDPCVLQCYYVTGETDFCLMIGVSSVEEFDRFTQHRLMSDDNVKSFTSSLVVRKSKTDLSAFIEHPASMDD
ncbi:Lrp/AsnC family transcriptional regulator [Vibrio quintilis]|uniref:HTH-type transcriptional regulator LrpC n=1 Tax=Vibrio quintilis TaxID=1117707 RepID=A0A1M7YXY2_9VIBR|nr:Lrp/AsnC family transcriptional regulator [Vibrio quintilis]SHO57454.1 HTH-type transcriptional regulator LrpC [Vibrio quintilis]